MFEQLLTQVEGSIILASLTLLLRVVLGIIIFPHGAQKFLGWYGGYGFKGSMNYFTDTLNIPYVFGLLAIVTEFFGSLALVLGLFTRAAALGILVVMAVAALKVHVPNGFFMNWFDNQQGEGFEFHIVAGAIALTLIILGGGAWSLDALLLSTLF